ncbi:hypothetical protein [Amycolatopsis albispora]|uniref:DUF3558 domain-containing protein n=1 Tax=Amycolatopsis albispora TaxID=1804986 RepID=A0A344LAA9_9PSEU|nr:hypothetical protein [Amycolatopsis albispora]AXB44983.1 hypothetical protein A4R43_22835 [Amycolatopsis albispora]
MPDNGFTVVLRKLLDGRVLAVAALLLLAACAPPDEAPPGGPPAIPRPVDVGALARTPCLSVPGEPGFVSRRELPDDRMFTEDGPQPVCELTGTGAHPVLKVRWFPQVRPVPLWRGRVRAAEELSVAGYPALLDNVETDGRADALKICAVYVDLADSQGAAVSFTTLQSDPVDACAESRRFAERVVSGLP